MATIVIDDPTPYIESMGSQTSPAQWVRELFMNPLEAGAKRIEVDPFNDVLYGAYGADKILFGDDGHGMAGKQLVQYMRHLLKSGKPIGGVGEHQGIGARISTLGWNRYGVVVISLRDGEMNLIWMHKDPGSGRYALADFDVDDDYTSVIRLSDYDRFEYDGVVWEDVVPQWVKDAGHGTVVVLLGNERDQNSNLGDPRVDGEGWRYATSADVRKETWTSPRQVEKVTAEGQKIYRNRPEWNYLNGRFWVLKKETEIPGYGTWEVTPINSDWQAETVRVRGMQAPSKVLKSGELSSVTDARPVIGGLRSIYDTKFDVKHGVVELDHPYLPARVHWFLRSGTPATEWKSIDRGYVAALYQDEVYERTRSFRPWGISYREIQDRVFLIVEPLPATGLVENVKGSEGVRPNAERSRLLWGSENSLDLPWEGWAQMFRSAEYMPPEILDAIKEYVAALPASENIDPEIIRRVMEHIEATYETEDQVLRRKAGSNSLFKGKKPETLPDPSGSDSKTKHEKALVKPPSPKPENPPLPEHEDGDTPGPIICPPSKPTAGTVEAKKKTVPVKITAKKKADTGGPLCDKKGKVPGTHVPKKGSPPTVRWVMQSEIADSMTGDESGADDHAGVLWDPPGADHPAGLLRLAKDHWAVEQVIERFGEDLPHVDQKEIRTEVQNGLAGAVLLRVLTIRRQRSRYENSDVLTAMLGTPALTDMLLLSNMEYDAVSTRLKQRHGAAQKIKKVV